MLKNAIRKLSALKKTIILIAIFAPIFATFAFAQNRDGGLLICGDFGCDTLYSKSYALIVGIYEYKYWQDLPGVAEDIDAVDEILKRHGFENIIVKNPDNLQLNQAITDFINRYGMNPKHQLLFYYAGHGHTMKSKYKEEKGFIVPANAPDPGKDLDDFYRTAITMEEFELFAKKIQSKHALFLFDACFSGQLFKWRARFDANIPISYKASRPVRQFITSGSENEPVPDKSIFRAHFVRALEGEADQNGDGFITGTELASLLIDRVIMYSRDTQHPQYGKIFNTYLDKGDYIFKILHEDTIKVAEAEQSDAPGFDRSSESTKTDIPGKYPISSKEKLNIDDLKNYSLDNLKIMRNEIFARHGYKFREGGDMDEYFRAQSWYQPRFDNVYRFLTEIELENIDTIKQAENSLK